MTTVATALAHPNIALAKYWGKLEHGHNLPAVPSISLTLDGLATRTRVSVEPSLAADVLFIGGQAASDRERERASRLCDLVFRPAPGRPRPSVRIESENDFPTAAGLASSASAFAALAVAADAVFAVGRTRAELSDFARRTSASAGRSLFGGFVELPAGGGSDAADVALPAVELAAADHWPVAIVVAVTTEGKKAVGSTEGMLHTARTSPYYQAWVASAPSVCDRVRSAVLSRDLAALGEAAEESALAMHAAALAARPGVIYWNGTTVDIMAAVRAERAAGVPAYFTIDAGPHVKVLCPGDRAADIARHLGALPGVLRTITARPGQGARVVES